MNSDYWQDLWRRQPPPAAPLDYEQLLRDVRADAEELDRELQSGKWVSILFLSLVALSTIPDFLLRAQFNEFFWGDCLLGVATIAWAGGNLAFRRRWQAIERGFQQSILDRIDRYRTLLRLRIRYYDWALVMVAVLMAAFIGAIWSVGWSVLADDLGTKSKPVAIAMISVFLFGLVLVAVSSIAVSRRKGQTRLRQRLAELEDIRTRLLSAPDKLQP
jgi:drug/metabolite transporter (DMT)-like permease